MPVIAGFRTKHLTQPSAEDDAGQRQRREWLASLPADAPAPKGDPRKAKLDELRRRSEALRATLNEGGR